MLGPNASPTANRQRALLHLRSRYVSIRCVTPTVGNIDIGRHTKERYKDRVTDNATIIMYKTHVWLRYL